jgi:hypothetical protein
MLSEAEVGELRDGTWRAHCPKMTVRKSTCQGVNAYEGGGFIERGSDGRLNFTLYSAAEYDLGDMLRSHGPLGQLIAEDEYYDLTAVDVKGRCWESKRLLLNTRSSVDTAGVVVDGSLDSLMCTTPYAVSPARHELELKFFDSIEIPGNAVTEVTTMVAGELRRRRSRRDAARFTSCGCEFEIRSEEGILSLSASAAEKLPPNLEVRVADALQFVLALPLKWGLLIRGERSETGIQIRSVCERHHRPKIGPPIAFRDRTCSRHIWELFEKYLGYILPYENKDKHDPVSTFVRRLLDASEGSIDAQALTLAVSVEGILKKLCVELEKLPEEKTAKLTKARKVIDEADIDSDVKHQIMSNLGNWAKAGPWDMLGQLVDAGVITDQERVAWRTLRNPSAHASLPNVQDYQKLVDLCCLTLMVFYKLIYYAIGYNGPYVDYGKPGWPLVGE